MPSAGFGKSVFTQAVLLFCIDAATQQSVAASLTISPLPVAASVQRDGPAEVVQRGDASAAEASHIDAVTLHEDRVRGALYIAQTIWYHSPKGNASRLHFELISISDTPLKIRVRDHPINAPSARQQRGTYIVVQFRCGPFQKSYSHVKRALIVDSDGEQSNSVDFVINCNLALTS